MPITTGPLAGVRAGDILVTAEGRMFPVKCVMVNALLFGRRSVAFADGSAFYWPDGDTTVRLATAQETVQYRAMEEEKRAEATILATAMRAL